MGKLPKLSTVKSKVVTEDLFTTADIKRVREVLVKEQQGKCAMTWIPTDNKDYHLDHAHDDEQLVRGALHKQSNMCLGKLENLYNRYLSYWYKGTISDFLRDAADYLEKPKVYRWRHPGWMKKVQTKFNRLPAEQMKKVLVQVAQPEGRNLTERKASFKQALLTKQFSFATITTILEKATNEI